MANVNETSTQKQAGLSDRDRAAHQRALRMALWLAVCHSEILGDDDVRTTATSLLQAVKQAHGVAGLVE